MGQENLEESEFEPMYQHLRLQLKGRMVALFGSYGWGDGEWMRNWEIDCLEAGAKLVSEPGIAQGPADKDAQEACRRQGAELVHALHDKK